MEYKLVYVAGKFRDPDPWQQELNIRAAEALAMEVWRMPPELGLVPICPHILGRFCDRTIPDSHILPAGRAILRVCHAMILVNNWHTSTGTKDEIREAWSRDIPVLDGPRRLDALDAWARGYNLAFYGQVTIERGDIRVG